MKRGYTVIIPGFPIWIEQSLEAWEKKFEEYTSYINSETVFIAHSIGPAFVCSVLEKLDTLVDACYFVSWFLWTLWLGEFDELNQTFTEKQFNWEKIKKNGNSFYMCHGSDDPYVPLSNAKQLSEKLWVEIEIIEKGWHLNSESGYNEFDELLEKIK